MTHSSWIVKLLIASIMFFLSSLVSLFSTNKSSSSDTKLGALSFTTSSSTFGDAVDVEGGASGTSEVASVLFRLGLGGTGGGLRADNGVLLSLEFSVTDSGCYLMLVYSVK